MEFDIIYEDEDIIVINKPSAVISDSERGVEGIMGNYFKEVYPWKKQLVPGLPHRLDRPVSGVLLIAKKRQVLKDLCEQFSVRSVKKFYIAAVHGVMPKKEQLLINYHYKSQEHKRAQINDERPSLDWLKISLKYRVLKNYEDSSLMRVELLTGKFHQIRAQLSHIGHPIKYDMKYGSALVNPEGAICLHAFRLTILHPTKEEEMTFEVLPPKTEIWEPYQEFLQTNKI